MAETNSSERFVWKRGDYMLLDEHGQEVVVEEKPEAKAKKTRKKKSGLTEAK